MTRWNREGIPSEAIEKITKTIDTILENVSDEKAKTYSRGAIFINKNVVYKIERYDKNEIDFNNPSWIVKNFLEDHIIDDEKSEDIVIPEFIGYLEALDKTGYINIKTKTSALIEMGARYFDVNKFI